MTKLLKKTKLIKQILQEAPETRGNDIYLLLEYYKRIGVDTNKGFKELLLSGQVTDITTIIRTRAKVQEHFPDLRDEKAWDARHCRQEVYVDYAMNVNRKEINQL